MAVTRTRRDDPILERWVPLVYDTRSNEGLGAIARAPGDDTLVSWHVTDRPDKLAAFLKRRGRLVAAYGPKGKHAELGPGLYLGPPSYWRGRSTPYNIGFWRGPAPSPSIVEVRFRGRFAELAGSRPPRGVLRTLRRMRLQGAFTHANASMGANPELVIWDPRAIVSARVAPEIRV